MTAERYSRQILFPGIGVSGQAKIGKSRVAVVGCGALGTVSAELLTRAGVGSLTLVDRDFVEWSNLPRQSLFTEADARDALPKAVAAARVLGQINSKCRFRHHVADLTSENIQELLGGSQVIVDATDNFETRYLLNDYAWSASCPWVYGACVGSYGIGFAFQPGESGCLQCLFPEPPDPGSLETCDTAGILAPVVHTVASFQVIQTLKLLSGQHPSRQIFQVDLWTDQFRTLQSREPNEDCRCCGKHEFRFLAGAVGSQLTRLCGRNAVQVSPANRVSLDFTEMARRLSRSARVTCNEYLMRIEAEGFEISLFPDGRSIIKGTEDPSKARSLYARYVGS